MHDNYVRNTSLRDHCHVLKVELGSGSQSKCAFGELTADVVHKHDRSNKTLFVLNPTIKEHVYSSIAAGRNLKWNTVRMSECRGDEVHL